MANMSGNKVFGSTEGSRCDIGHESAFDALMSLIIAKNNWKRKLRSRQKNQPSPPDKNSETENDNLPLNGKKDSTLWNQNYGGAAVDSANSLADRNNFGPDKTKSDSGRKNRESAFDALMSMSKAKNDCKKKSSSHKISRSNTDSGVDDKISTRDTTCSGPQKADIFDDDTLDQLEKEIMGTNCSDSGYQKGIGKATFKSSSDADLGSGDTSNKNTDMVDEVTLDQLEKALSDLKSSHGMDNSDDGDTVSQPLTEQDEEAMDEILDDVYNQNSPNAVRKGSYSVNTTSSHVDEFERRSTKKMKSQKLNYYQSSFYKKIKEENKKRDKNKKTF